MKQCHYERRHGDFIKKLESATYYTSIKSNMELADYRYQVAAATMADVMGITGKE
jgi:hypothetical protein